VKEKEEKRKSEGKIREGKECRKNKRRESVQEK